MNTVVDSEIFDLLERNSVDLESFFKETYQCLIVSLFEAMVSEMQDIEYKKQVKDRLRNSVNKRLTVKNIIYEKTKCKISDEEAEELYRYIYAFFTKLDSRKNYEFSDKKKILMDQNGECNICHRKIKMNIGELDHIIPWIMVGDELGKSNLQMLCKECNKRKSKSIGYNLKMFLINR